MLLICIDNSGYFCRLCVIVIFLLWGYVFMNKTELIRAMVLLTKKPTREVGLFVDAFIKTIKNELRKDMGFVTLLGFGRFYVSLRTARYGKNPKTGEGMFFNEINIPKFKAGKMLRNYVNMKKGA